MANELVLGKLRFDTAELTKQLADVTARVNEVKRLATQVKAVGGNSGSRGGGDAKSQDTQIQALRQ